MALIDCPECGREVSSAAATCPNCGVAIASKSESRAAGAPLTTVQQTSKKLKSHTAVSALMLIGGITWAFSTISADDTPAEHLTYAVLIAAAGGAWFVVTRLRIWWHHG